jgi:hypothetical protein
MQRWGDYWRLTSLSARLLFADVYASRNVIIQTYGNPLSGTAFLQGIASGELKRKELDYTDPDYEVLIAVRAEK